MSCAPGRRGRRGRASCYGAGVNEGFTRFADGVWIATEPARILGMRLTATMTALRLPGGGLLLYSPIRLTPAREAAARALGPVRHLYAPNLFHHLHIGAWAAAFPEARVHAPPGLQEKRPDLRVDRLQDGEGEPDFDGVIDELPIAGFRLAERALCYRPARTLLVADLVHNVGAPSQPWARFYTRAMGFYDRVALSRMIRWTGFSDRAAARRSVDELLARPFDRLVVGHGAPLEGGAQEALATAYAWLPQSP